MIETYGDLPDEYLEPDTADVSDDEIVDAYEGEEDGTVDVYTIQLPVPRNQWDEHADQEYDEYYEEFGTPPYEHLGVDPAIADVQRAHRQNRSNAKHVQDGQKPSTSKHFDSSYQPEVHYRVTNAPGFEFKKVRAMEHPPRGKLESKNGQGPRVNPREEALGLRPSGELDLLRV